MRTVLKTPHWWKIVSFLVRARSIDEAIRKGECEAHKYAAEASHRNPYGQRVKRRYLNDCDAFELWDDPANGDEVFSTTEVVTPRGKRRGGH